MATPLSTAKDNNGNRPEKMSGQINDKISDKINDKVHDATDRFTQNVDDYQQTAQRLAGQASDKISEVYGGASDWLQENPGRAIGFAALFVGVTLLGFFIGRGLGGGDRNVEHY